MSFAFLPQVTGLCQQAGVAEAVVAKVLEVGGFNTSAVPLLKFVFVMLAMSCEDFNRVCMGVFDVFSDNGSLAVEQFVKLVGYLGPDMDPEITPTFLAALQADLSGAGSVTYMEICEAPSLKQKLGLS